MTVGADDITGLVLAGGRSTRMGGLDKGLRSYLGVPLVKHALVRLAPQVSCVAINANRHVESYEAFGVPVWPDSLPEYPGPLAGMLVGLERCPTAYLVTVPCDTPNFPHDLVRRLARGLAQADAEMAMAVTQEKDELLPQPVFMLMKRSLRESAFEFLRAGQGKVGLWVAQHHCAQVVFEDHGNFFNANTPGDLEQLGAGLQ